MDPERVPNTRPLSFSWARRILSTTSILLRDNFNIILPSNTMFSKCSLPSDFPTKTMYTTYFSSPPSLSHVLRYLITLMISGKDYRSGSSLLCSFSPVFCHFILGLNIFLSILFSNTLSQCSFFNVRDQVSRHKKDQPWRWPQERPKHGGDHNTIKLRPYNQVNLLVLIYFVRVNYSSVYFCLYKLIMTVYLKSGNACITNCHSTYSCHVHV